MTTKSSGFTLIELLVVVAILGILSTVGIISYQGYISGAKQKSVENAMQQISLAQTEEYSNSGEYFTQICEDGPSDTSTAQIELVLFAGGDVITKDSGYEVCIVEDDTSYIIQATKKKKTLTMTANGVWTGK